MKFFTLSFDDGIEQDKRLINLMKRYGLSGTFNLNSGLLGKRHDFANISHIPKDEVPEVYAGFEVASHGFKHEMYQFMSGNKTRETLSQDFQELSSIMGYKIKGHAYPYGMQTKAAESYLKSQNVLYARKVSGKSELFRFPENPLSYVPTCWFNAKNVMELLDQFIKAEPSSENMLFMMWGHSYEMDMGFRPCPEPQLERIFSKIAGKPGITYCTNKEAFEGASN
ncbi:MAG: polysaccharide deacetylase family protein [Clostridiales bacterium]|jgi:peptidoglycan/xylan/chitin deacetylase (PgdA/CDA1 family)|nr:polysaccharide deacetylase family protein [Clostridiales bacterium]